MEERHKNDRGSYLLACLHDSNEVGRVPLFRHVVSVDRRDADAGFLDQSVQARATVARHQGMLAQAHRSNEQFNRREAYSFRVLEFLLPILFGKELDSPSARGREPPLEDAYVRSGGSAHRIFLPMKKRLDVRRCRAKRRSWSASNFR